MHDNYKLQYPKKSHIKNKNLLLRSVQSVAHSFIQSIEPSSHNGMWKDEDGKNDGTDKIESTTSDGTDGTLTEIADLKALET